jgi:hypothetical protein
MTGSQWRKLRLGGRQWQRLFTRAIRGSWIRALAELITNSDDSYTRLLKAGVVGSGTIVVDFDRARDTAWFRVIDEAEGMSADRLEEVFKEYGGEVAAGPDARGFFNRGAKDALLAMEGGREDSIKDGEYASMELRTVLGEEPERRLTGPHKATAAIRRRLRLPENGTVASFRLPEGYQHVPQQETVRTALARFWMLRKIVDPDNATRRLVLRYRGQDVEIISPQPVGEALISKPFQLRVEGFPDFDYQLTLKKASQDLDQTTNSDQRVGGLLVVDEGDAVLDLTLGRFDREPSAAPFFGEVKILGGFKDFLRAQEKEGQAVLSEERNGFELSHHWVQSLIRSIEDKIEPFVEQERKAREKGQQDLSPEERAHQAKVMSELNKILEDETRKTWTGDQDTDRVTLPAGGLEIRPIAITISEGSQRYLFVRADPAKCPPETVIYIEDEAGTLAIEPQEFKVEDDGELVFVRAVKISGGSAGQTGRIVAISSECTAEATYQVVPDAYPSFDGEIMFIPSDVSIVDQKISTVSLYVKTTAIPAGETIWITSSEDESVAVLSPGAYFDPRDVRGDIGKVRMRVRGVGVGKSAVLTAKHGATSAQATVTVRSEHVPPPSRKGLFRKIEYSDKESVTERFHFEQATGTIFIHLLEPTILLHLGAVGEFRELLNARTLVAELVTQCVAGEVAQRKLETGARIYFDSTPAGQFQEDQEEIRALIHKHGAAIHKSIVDVALLREARKVESEA